MAGAVFMREDHGIDDSRIQVDHSCVAKAEELVVSTDPDKGVTGNVLYGINGVYRQPEGTGQPREKALARSHFGAFLEALGTYGQVVVTNGEVTVKTAANAAQLMALRRRWCPGAGDSGCARPGSAPRCGWTWLRGPARP